MNINQEKLLYFIEDLNKTFDELAKTSEDRERINVFKIKHHELFCGFNIRRMNIEVNHQKKEEKLIEAVSKSYHNSDNNTLLKTVG